MNSSALDANLAQQTQGSDQASGELANASTLSGRSIFAEPTSGHVRPGDASLFEGSGCTINFLYEHQGRYFFGSAAHCVSGAGVANEGACDTSHTWHDDYTGLPVEISGMSKPLTVAYMSWKAMAEQGVTDGNICSGNDFALLEVDVADYDKIHPAVRMFGGPTGLAAIEDMQSLDELRAYGRSELHDDTLLLDPEQSVLNPKNGFWLGCSFECWSNNVYLLPQGIPGDSGGGVMDINGRALGAASTISLAGGSNNYADIGHALTFMQSAEGWAPRLVTWNDFDPSAGGALALLGLSPTD
ncbi:MAG: hypothetical protein ACSHXK_12480 [Oceanococcus sp.]